MQPNPKDQYRAERQIEKLYLIKSDNEKRVYPGETLPTSFWEWTELEFKALKHMYHKGWDIWDMAQELGKNPTAVAVAVALWGEERKIKKRPNGVYGRE